MSSSNTTNTEPQPSSSSSSTSSDLFALALANLPPQPSSSSEPDKAKPLVFTNLLRFRPVAEYTSPPIPSLSSDPLPLPTCSGQEAYWNRYFPIYHRACRETLGDEAETLQQVLYKGSPLMPLRLSNKSVAGGQAGTQGGEKYWDAVVVTRCESWAVAERIGKHKEYSTVAGWHRAAAVEDDELYVSCPVDGFEMMKLD